MEEYNTWVAEKYEVQFDNESKQIQFLLDFSYHQVSETTKRLTKSFHKIFSTRLRRSIDNLVGEIEPVVTQKFVCEKGKIMKKDHLELSCI